MKRILTIGICLLMISSQAQTLTDKYLKMTPSLPKDTCNITRAGIENFVAKVSEVSDQLSFEMESLSNMAEKQMEDNEEVAKANIMKQMSQQYGLSPEQMQKMQSGNMSEADKQALANQVLQQQANMSMSEVQNLSKMSESGKKAYMEAYGTEMAAAGQSAQSKQNASSAKNMNELLTQQQALTSKIKATINKISDLYAAIENDPQLKKSEDNIDKWSRKLTSMMGEVSRVEAKQMDSLVALITAEKIIICNKFTPRMLAALKQHFQLMKSVIPDANKLGHVTAEITKLQTGVGVPIESTEIEGLGIIQGYLGELKSAYKFKRHFPEEE